MFLSQLRASGGTWKRTSVQHDVVDHIALVFGVVEAEGAAEVFGEVFRFTAVVTCLHVHGEAVPARIQRQNKRTLKLWKAPTPPFVVPF